MGPKAAKTETAEILDGDYHLTLKRKLLGVEKTYPSLAMPRKIEPPPAAVIRPGTPEQAGVKPDAAERIRNVCRDWYTESKEPFVTLIARRGVIVIHEAFGEGSDGPVPVDTAMWMASITKGVTGALLGQFIDQGLIALDDPIGEFLPDFPIEGDKAITVRHCFTHTTGLEGHGEYGGVQNPWMDNVVANGLSYLRPGKVFIYNGVGYNLAGKVMEVVSGKNIFRLMHENFFDPLTLRDTTVTDLGGGTMSTALDMAKIGQLLLNKGSYGDLEFFSPKVLKQLLPQPLDRFYPAAGGVEWGIGFNWRPRPRLDAPASGQTRRLSILQRNMIGHGAASGAVFRIDPDNDLVIIQSRNRMGEGYSKHLGEFFLAVESGLTD
jgi:CubicO group peptidase (beta-lactamase class C family)